MITLTTISTPVVSTSGGSLLTITGVFDLTHDYRVHIGPRGTIDDPIAYRGPNQANSAPPFTSTQLRCFTPRQKQGALYSVLVVDETAPDTGLLANVLTYLPSQQYTSVFDYRRVWPARYRVGPRHLENLQ